MNVATLLRASQIWITHIRAVIVDNIFYVNAQ
jgi:replicative superfamily II helicase